MKAKPKATPAKKTARATKAKAPAVAATEAPVQAPELDLEPWRVTTTRMDAATLGSAANGYGTRIIAVLTYRGKKPPL